MINHVRTLLLNRSGTPPAQRDVPGEEFVDPAFVQRLLPTYLRAPMQMLFGSHPDRIYLNYRMRQIMQLLHQTELEEYLYVTDRRVTYLPFNNSFDGVFQADIDQYRGTSKITLIGEHFAEDGPGIMKQQWNVKVMLGSSVQIIKRTPPRSSILLDLVTQGTRTRPVPLPGSGLKFEIQDPLPADEWEIYSTGRPRTSLAELLPQFAAGLGDVGLLGLFGVAPAEPLLTFRNLYLNNDQFGYKYSGLLLAVAEAISRSPQAPIVTRPTPVPLPPTPQPSSSSSSSLGSLPSGSVSSVSSETSSESSAGCGSHEQNGLWADMSAYFPMTSPADHGPYSLDLTNSGATFVSNGKIDYAANFDASDTQYMSRAHDARLEIGNGHWSASLWVYLEGGNGILFSKENSVGVGNRSYELYVYPDLKVGWFCRRGDDAGFVEAQSTPLTLGTWAWIVVDHDPDTDTIGIRINNGSRTSAAFTDGGVFEGGSQFNVGYWPNSGGSNFLDGRIAELLIMPRQFTTSERSHLWEAGAGRTLCAPLADPPYLTGLLMHMGPWSLSPASTDLTGDTVADGEQAGSIENLADPANYFYPYTNDPLGTPAVFDKPIRHAIGDDGAYSYWEFDGVDDLMRSALVEAAVTDGSNGWWMAGTLKVVDTANDVTVWVTWSNYVQGGFVMAYLPAGAGFNSFWYGSAAAGNNGYTNASKNGTGIHDEWLSVSAGYDGAGGRTLALNGEELSPLANNGSPGTGAYGPAGANLAGIPGGTPFMLGGDSTFGGIPREVSYSHMLHYDHVPAQPDRDSVNTWVRAWKSYLKLVG